MILPQIMMPCDLEYCPCGTGDCKIQVFVYSRPAGVFSVVALANNLHTIRMPGLALSPSYLSTGAGHDQQQEAEDATHRRSYLETHGVKTREKKRTKSGQVKQNCVKSRSRMHVSCRH